MSSGVGSCGMQHTGDMHIRKDSPTGQGSIPKVPLETRIVFRPIWNGKSLNLGLGNP